MALTVAYTDGKGETVVLMGSPERIMAEAPDQLVNLLFEARMEIMEDWLEPAGYLVHDTIRLLADYDGERNIGAMTDHVRRYYALDHLYYALDWEDGEQDTFWDRCGGNAVIRREAE